MYLEFWEHLNPSNSSPDIGKLNEIALKINNTITSIEIHWKNMQIIKPNDPKALRLYAGFLIEVLNDKEKGNELLSLWRETADKKQTYIGYLEIKLNENLVNSIKDGNALILCSAEPDSFGNIIKFSNSTCKIFGYTQSELYGKTLEYLLLECYSGKINYYIDSQLQKNQSETNLGEIFFGRSKYHHAFPFYLNILEYKGGNKESNSFIAVINFENHLEELKKNVRIAYFIVDSRLKILNFSSLAFEFVTKFFGKFNTDSYYYFHDLFPDLSSSGNFDYKHAASNKLLIELNNENEENEYLNSNQNLPQLNSYGSMRQFSLFRTNKSIKTRIFKSNEIQNDCEKDSYYIELSCNSLNGIIQNFDPTKISNSLEPQLIDEEENRLYAISMKIPTNCFSGKKEKDILYVKCEIYPKLDQIYEEIRSKGHKNFMELIKSNFKKNFHYYNKSELGEPITDYVNSLTSKGWAGIEKKWLDCKVFS